MKVQVLTVTGQPEIEVSTVWEARVIDRIIFKKYGRQSNGSPHNWHGPIRQTEEQKGDEQNEEGIA